MQLMAQRLAERHRIPESDIVHPKVFVMNGDGTVDTFMTDKLREPHYVPYCLKQVDCGRVRRREWGFYCPCCGNKMNWDLSHYDGNALVKFDGPPPPKKVPSKKVPPIKDWNAQVEERKQLRAQRRLEKHGT